MLWKGSTAIEGLAGAATIGRAADAASSPIA
jgi:hypothetical protein